MGSGHDKNVKDEQGNECKMEDNFIMGNRAYGENITKFSSCSINSFKKYLLNKGLV